MLHLSLEVHPVYGAIPRDGDTVKPGDVLGLSTDSREVVVAPVGGRVRLVTTESGPGHRVLVEILNENELPSQHAPEPPD